MQQVISCPKCGSENQAGQQFCGVCGAKFVIETPTKTTVPCHKCGSQNPAGQQFCGACGTELAADKKQEPSKIKDKIISSHQIKMKPTWGLAWGITWRGWLFTLLILVILYLILLVVMLAFDLKIPVGS